MIDMQKKWVIPSYLYQWAKPESIDSWDVSYSSQFSLKVKSTHQKRFREKHVLKKSVENWCNESLIDGFKAVHPKERHLEFMTRHTSLIYEAIKSHSKPSKALHRKAPETSSRDKLVQFLIHRFFKWFLLVVLEPKKGFFLKYNVLASYRNRFEKWGFPIE